MGIHVSGRVQSTSSRPLIGSRTAPPWTSGTCTTPPACSNSELLERGYVQLEAREAPGMVQWTRARSGRFQPVSCSGHSSIAAMAGNRDWLMADTFVPIAPGETVRSLTHCLQTLDSSQESWPLTVELPDGERHPVRAVWSDADSRELVLDLSDL